MTEITKVMKMPLHFTEKKFREKNKKKVSVYLAPKIHIF